MNKRVKIVVVLVDRAINLGKGNVCCFAPDFMFPTTKEIVW